MTNFRYADIHCHPNLKTFGHSFDKRKSGKSEMWNQVPASFIAKKIHSLTGVTKFSQCSFSAMAKGKAKIISLSLYPFEKGFFSNPAVSPKIGAFLGDWAIEIGYRRIRYLQSHKNYFEDLQHEYDFVINSRQQQDIDGKTYRWQLTRNWQEVETVLQKADTIAVIISIEGAHVFNCGLAEFGVETSEEEVLSNIQKVKNWEYAPLFIGLAHNFNNELCGHARSLQRLGRLVDQSNNLGTGLAGLGIKVIHALLDDKNGRSIYIDLKHMSLLSRKEYLQLLKTDYAHRKIPLIVSHGAVTGSSFNGNKQDTGCIDIFNTADINFFDEEIISVANSGGLLSLQMDIGINADPKKLKKNMPVIAGERPVRRSARIIWNQLQHIAMVLDSNGSFAWGSTAIGSDFDGSINPFPGIVTAEDFQPMGEELVLLAKDFLSNNKLSIPENRQISAEEIVDRFLYGNTESFLKEFF